MGEPRPDISKGVESGGVVTRALRRASGAVNAAIDASPHARKLKDALVGIAFPADLSPRQVMVRRAGLLSGAAIVTRLALDSYWPSNGRGSEQGKVVGVAATPDAAPTSAPSSVSVEPTLSQPSPLASPSPSPERPKLPLKPSLIEQAKKNKEFPTIAGIVEFAELAFSSSPGVREVKYPKGPDGYGLTVTKGTTKIIALEGSKYTVILERDDDLTTVKDNLPPDISDGLQISWVGKEDGIYVRARTSSSFGLVAKKGTEKLSDSDLRSFHDRGDSPLSFKPDKEVPITDEDLQLLLSDLKSANADPAWATRVAKRLLGQRRYPVDSENIDDEEYPTMKPLFEMLKMGLNSTNYREFKYPDNAVNPEEEALENVTGSEKIIAYRGKKFILIATQDVSKSYNSFFSKKRETSNGMSLRWIGLDDKFARKFTTKDKTVLLSEFQVDQKVVDEWKAGKGTKPITGPYKKAGDEEFAALLEDIKYLEPDADLTERIVGDMGMKWRTESSQYQAYNPAEIFNGKPETDPNVWHESVKRLGALIKYFPVLADKNPDMVKTMRELASTSKGTIDDKRLKITNFYDKGLRTRTFEFFMNGDHDSGDRPDIEFRQTLKGENMLTIELSMNDGKLIPGMKPLEQPIEDLDKLVGITIDNFPEVAPKMFMEVDDKETMMLAGGQAFMGGIVGRHSVGDFESGNVVGFGSRLSAAKDGRVRIVMSFDSLKVQGPEEGEVI